MSVFEKSKWIWIKDGGGNDEYGEFTDSFEYSGGEAKMLISVDGDYTLYINGKYVEANQFGDFEHYKIYDEMDITEHLSIGENKVYILVWHFGAPSMRYRPAAAGLIYEITSGEKVLTYSSEQTRSRKSKCYQNGRSKNITPQLGPGFLYDANNEDDAVISGAMFEKSITVTKNCEFFPRVGEKMRLGEEVKPAWIKNYDGCHYLIDLGAEVVGIPVLRFESTVEQKIIVAWGEHIDDGYVRKEVGGRDFTFEYIAKPGKNDYTNYMLRLGLRYIEIFAEENISLDTATVVPQYYPTERKKAVLSDSLDQRIYDLCLRTLELSMMEHYVDCPWREQCLYVFDSRNQMLCGYYAFKGGNAEYVRANLKLIMHDTRDDGLLSITYPSGLGRAIPSFSLHFYTSLREYYEHTGDAGILKEAYPKLVSVMNTFIKNRENGLLKRFGDVMCWNFYDWSDNLAGTLGEAEVTDPDLVCNCLFIKALENFKFISNVIGEKFNYEDELCEAKHRTRATFFEPKSGLFTHIADEHIYTALGNALAITVGLASKEESRVICEAIKAGKASECSLSMKPFIYDALLETDESYKQYILAEIRKHYGHMLDCGATSAWETIRGAEDFEKAGSLCHGWSAIPIYYYCKFGMVNE